VDAWGECLGAILARKILTTLKLGKITLRPKHQKKQKPAAKTAGLEFGSGFGARNRSRTYDLRITNALLYQLSYSGNVRL
jgi:hypothetical protein